MPKAVQGESPSAGGSEARVPTARRKLSVRPDVEVLMTAVLTMREPSAASVEPDLPQALPRTPSALGICATCNYVGTCTGRATWAGPVFHCEEFDDRREMSQAPAMPAPSEEGRAPAAVARFGLCLNCRHQETCGFRGGQDGVWHCEEYE
jgi:hypothetical protein